MSRFGVRLLPILLILASGCAARGARADRAPIQKIQEEKALASLLETVQPGGSNYQIGPADLLEITIYREKDLNRTLRVSQKGEISFPLIGVVKVSELSVVEAEQTVSKRLREFLVSPQVTLFIKEYGNKKIHVLGEVKKPGAYDLPTEGRLTVLEAISLAGGFTPVAARDRTKIIRSNSKGENRSIEVEVSAITKRGEKDKDIALEPTDVVYVPQSFF